MPELSLGKKQIWTYPGAAAPFHAFVGMPGVGKTYTLTGVHLQKVLAYDYKRLYITSQTTFAIETALARLDEEAQKHVVCSTFHSMVYKWGTEDYSESGPYIARPPEPHKVRVFQKGIDAEALLEYARRAPSNLPKEVQNRRDYLATFDPFNNPDPVQSWVFDKPIHRSLRYDMTLLRYWADLDHRELDLREGSRQAGFIFVDEAQDMTPLQAYLLLRFAKEHLLAVRVYGDPHQQINYDYPAPLFEFAQPEETTILEGEPAFKRVPIGIARVAHALLPDAPPPEVWANLNKEGAIRSFSDRIYPVSRGYSLSISRAGVLRAVEHCPRQRFAATPQAARKAGWCPSEQPVFCTIHAAKGWEAPSVTIQPLKPAYMRKLREGDPVMRKLLFTAITRAQDIVYLPTPIYNLCMSLSTDSALSA